MAKDIRFKRRSGFDLWEVSEGGGKVLKKMWEMVKKEALSIVAIILFVIYIFISYKTYVIQQERYKIDCQTYELTVQIDELVHQMEWTDPEN